MRRVLTIAMLLVVAVPYLHAAVPTMINYQGLLTDGGGNPVLDGNYSVMFSLYNSPTGGSPLWTEVQTVATSNGLFNVLLGSAIPLPDTAVMDTAAYLEITIDNDPPLSPRVRLTSTAYSIASRAVDGEGPVLLRTVDDGLGQTATLALDIVPNQGGTSKNIRKNISVITLASGDSATANEVLGLDSGLTRSIAIDNGGNTLNVYQRFGASPSPPTRMAIAIPNLLDARKSGNESSASTAESREIMDADSGYTHTAGMTKADLISTIAKKTSESQEQILLAREVGASGATDSRSLKLQTDNDAVSAQLHRGNATDSSGLDIRADDDSTTLTLYSTTSSSRYSNIVLKRGLTTGAEMRIGYDGAAPSAMLYANSNPATGAQLGINTTSPTVAFHLVGSGCYTGTFGACSDERYKEDITTLSNPLNIVSQLRGVTFDWNKQRYPEQQFPDGEQIGVIAQEVERVVPGVVHTDDDGYKSVDYARLVPLLIESIKEQQRQIDVLRSELDEVKSGASLGQR